MFPEAYQTDGSRDTGSGHGMNNSKQQNTHQRTQDRKLT